MEQGHCPFPRRLKLCCWEFTIFNKSSVNRENLKWDKINLIYKINHQNILKVMEKILTLPATSSEAERGFSQVKLIKTIIRSKLSNEN